MLCCRRRMRICGRDSTYRSLLLLAALRLQSDRLNLRVDCEATHWCPMHPERPPLSAAPNSPSGAANRRSGLHDLQLLLLRAHGGSDFGAHPGTRAPSCLSGVCRSIAFDYGGRHLPLEISRLFGRQQQHIVAHRLRRSALHGLQFLLLLAHGAHGRRQYEGRGRTSGGRGSERQEEVVGTRLLGTVGNCFVVLATS